MSLSDANILGIYQLAGIAIPSLVPVAILLISNRNARLALAEARREAAEAARAAADATAIRDRDAVLARAVLTKSVADVHTTVDEVKKQTDGVIERVSALAEAAGFAKGDLSGQKTGEETGKQRAQDVQAVVAEAVKNQTPDTGV